MNKSFFWVSICLPLLLAVSGTPRADAQIFAEVAGRVLDSSGRPIARVLLQAHELHTAFQRPASTDEFGRYVLTGLPPGDYRISIVHEGFKPVRREGISLAIGQRLEMNFELEVGEVFQAIEVAAPVSVLETSTSSIGQVIEGEYGTKLPLDGRNFLSLATLVPGAVGVSYGPTGTVMSGKRPSDQRPGSELFVNGNREQSNNILLDGVENSFRRNGLVTLRPSLESIREFKVQTNLFSAEYGRKPGASIDVITKSGSNEFHGSAYEFLRNSAADARDFFAAEGPKPVFRQNQFGASLGGPIAEDRVFFFANYEGFRKSFEEISVNTVPNLQQRNGDFSGGPKVFDFASTRPDSTQGSGFFRDPFPDGQIPSSRFDPVSARLIQAYPSPSTAGAANNHLSRPGFRQRWDQGDLRIDANTSESSRIFGRFSRQDVSTWNPATFTGLSVPGLTEPVDLGDQQPAGRSMLVAHHSVLGWNHALSPTLLIDARMGFARFDSDFRHAGVAEGSRLGEQLGVPNANQGPNSDAIPIMLVSGFSGVGHSRALPTIRIENTLHPRISLTKVAGRHTIKLGADIIRRQVTDFQLSSAAGRFEFTREFTADPDLPAVTGSSMASFLLGAASAIEQDFLLAWVGIRTIETGAYIQDDFRLSGRLTLNLGLRYDYDRPLSEVADRWLNFDVVTGEMRIAGYNADSHVGVRPDRNNFAPRFGFAYRFGEKTVLRGGYGVYYNTQGNGRVSFRLHRQIPFGPVNVEDVNLLGSDPRLLQDGLRPMPEPDFADAAENPSGNLMSLADDFRSGYVHQYNLQIQRELADAHTVITAGYIGNLGRRLQTFFDFNQPVPGPGAPSSRRPLRLPAPEAAEVRYGVSDGLSSYHALQLSLQRTLQGGFGLRTSYTWSHSIDNVPNEQGGAANGPVPQDIRDRAADRASSGFDVRHRLVQTLQYELPFGIGKRWKSSTPWINAPFGDWRVNVIMAVQSGLPFTPELANSLSNAGPSRPDRWGSGYLSSPDPSQWFDTSFNIPQAAWGAPPIYTFGNSGRNVLRGPGRANLDLSLAKDVSLSEQTELQLRLEAFNLLNTPQFDLPHAEIGSSRAGTITKTLGVPRRLQLAVRFAF